MKRYSWMIMAFVAVNVALFGQQSGGNQPTTQEQRQCLEIEEEDTTDALAIPLDEDAYDQCMEEDRLQKGSQKK